MIFSNKHIHLYSKRFFFCIGIICFFTISLAQPPASKRKFNENKWREITKDKVYQEDQKPKQKIVRVEGKKPHVVYEYKIEKKDLFTKTIVSPIFLFIVVIVLLLLLIYFIFKKQLLIKNKSIKNKHIEFSILDIEENLEQVELDEYIKKAISGNNYKLAIRLHYLNVLKQLSAADLIKWKKDKTNKNYLNELIQQSFVTQFRYLTVFFEKVWYGDAEANKQIYLEFKKMNDDFVINIPKNANEK